MNTITCTCTLGTLARTKRSWLRIVTRNENPYESTMGSRFLKRLTEHVIGKIAKVSGKLPSAFVGKDFCCLFCCLKFMERLQQRATFRATVRSQLRGNPQGHALHRTIDTVTMPMCDVLLRHFCKMMLYTESICIAYSYLLYTLVNTHKILCVGGMMCIMLCRWNMSIGEE